MPSVKQFSNRNAARNLLEIAIQTFSRRINPGCGPGFNDMAPITAIAELSDVPKDIAYKAVLEKASQQRALDLFDFIAHYKSVLSSVYGDALPAIERIDRIPTHHFNAVSNYLCSGEESWDGSPQAEKLRLQLEDME